ncbi:MAG: hypothetical protein CML66_05850 [Rhodobacteraceae bacterium]|nr:hypothetical protein [Paracoccaceae bacterium]MAY46526.1 hypothetical protein [Paracoccaceae bacterium]
MNMELETALQIETNRVREALGHLLAEVEADGGDIRCFSAALLTAAVQLHAEVEGPDGLARALASLGRREMVRDGRAGTA